jgi:branched-chain amino acid transport system permease protein
MVAAAAISLLLELCLFRPIRARTGSFIAAELPTFLASIGVAGALEAWVDERTNGESLPVGSRFFSSHSYAFHHLFNITNLDVLVIVLGTLGTVGLAAWVAKARQGRAVRAVAYDATTARLMGINANLVASVTVAVGGAMAGLAGVLLAIRFGSVQFQMGDSLLLYALVIVVIGGQGSVWGAAVGSLAVALIQTEQVSYFPGIDPDLILFGMVIALLLVRPQGIAGAQVVEKL